MPFIRRVCRALGVSPKFNSKFSAAMFVAEHTKLHILYQRILSAFVTLRLAITTCSVVQAAAGTCAA